MGAFYNAFSVVHGICIPVGTTPRSAALLQLGTLQRNYWGTGLLENLAGDMTGGTAAVEGFLVLRYCWREQ